MSVRKRKQSDRAKSVARERGPGDKVSVRETSAGRDAGSAQALDSAFTSWPTTLIPAVIIILAGLAAYANSFAGAFVFDDVPNIVDNHSLHSLWPLREVLFPPANAAFGVEGRPLINLSLAVNYAWSGTDPWSYHAVNLVIHLAAALVLFGLVRRTLLLPALSGRFGAHATALALAVALLWTLHPLQTESVTYVIQRAESLMGLFYLLTLYCVLRGATAQHSTTRWYFAAVVVCLLGMATKEVMATAPILVLLYDRTFLAGTFRNALQQRIGLYLALAATWSVIAWGLISTGFHAGTTGFAVKEFTWQSYLLTQPVVILHYLWLAFCPLNLCLDYGWPPVTNVGAALVPGALVVSLLALTVWATWKRPKLGFLGACFFLILAPTSSFVPISDAAFEHRMYLPLLAVIAGVVLLGYAALPTTGWIARWSNFQKSCLNVVLLTTGCLVLGTLTAERNAAYASELSIWQDTVQKASLNARAQNNLGHAIAETGATAPDVERADAAIDHYREAIKLKPDYAEAHNNLGIELAKRGQLDQAKQEYRLAIKSNPDLVDAYNNLGVALLSQGQTRAAVDNFRTAAKLKPDLAPVQYNLGDALDRAGQSRDAVACLRESIRLNPDDIVVLNRLAWVLATTPEASVRNGPEAVALAEQICSRTPQPVAEVLDSLAAAYAEVGQFERAAATQRKALDRAPDALKPAFTSRLELYQANQPFRESPPLPVGD